MQNVENQIENPDINSVYIHALIIFKHIFPSVDVHKVFHHSFFQRFRPEFHSQRLKVIELGHSATRDAETH